MVPVERKQPSVIEYQLEKSTRFLAGKERIGLVEGSNWIELQANNEDSYLLLFLYKIK